MSIKILLKQFKFSFVSWGIDWNDEKFLKDLKVWKKQRKLDMSDKKATAILSSDVKEFRNLVLYRHNNNLWRHVYKLFYKPFETLDIVSKDVGGGLYIQHGFGTGLSAKSIGENCWVNQDVTVGYSGNNDKIPIIGNNVTLCAGARILGGVTVGDNAIVGANAVVVKDVEPNTVVGGVPAKKIKDRTDIV